MTLKSYISLLTLAFGSTSYLSALDEQGFRQCISTNGSGSICQLDAKPTPYHITNNQTHLAEGPFRIDRSGIVVSGTWITSRSDTTLLRANSGVGPLMYLNSGVNNVSIRDFFFDGNRRALGPTRPSVDLDLDWNGNAYAITVESEFYDARENSLSTAADNTIIEYAFIHHAAYSGIRVNEGNTAFTIRWNRIEDCGGSAIVVHNNSPGSIHGNTIARNHKEWPWWTCNGQCVGGQIMLDIGTFWVTVADNWIDGALVQNGNLWTAGMEVYGSGHLLLRNHIFHHSGHGIYLTGASNVLIEGGAGDWRVGNNNHRVVARTFSGIHISNHQLVPSLSNNITIKNYGSTNHHLYPVSIETRGIGSITGITVVNNCFSGNVNSSIYTSGVVDLYQSGNLYSNCP